MNYNLRNKNYCCNILTIGLTTNIINVIFCIAGYYIIKGKQKQFFSFWHDFLSSKTKLAHCSSVDNGLFLSHFLYTACNRNLFFYRVLMSRGLDFS